MEKSKNKCWEWKGLKDKKGYGVLMVNRKTFKAHRLSYLLFNPSILMNQISVELFVLKPGNIYEIPKSQNDSRKVCGVLC